jgi:hypothetical protein
MGAFDSLSAHRSAVMSCVKWALILERNLSHRGGAVL